jgi:SAM-dependent methyltransferase
MGSPLRRWFNTVVRFVMMRLLTTPYLGAYSVPFIPHRRGEETYLIRRQPAPTTADPERMPVPPRELWEGFGGESAAQYLASGRDQVRRMEEILAGAGSPLDGARRILDFGCATGRMTRWLAPLAVDREIWGVDVNSEYIHWCRAHLSPPLHFLTSTTYPHLPFEDRYFDVVYAGSVFTHIDDLAGAWLAELGRVIRPGGQLYFSFCDRKYSELVHRRFGGTPVERQYLRYRQYPRYIQSDFATFTLGRSMLSIVFYDREYLRDLALPLFDVVSFHDEAYGIQSVALLQRRDTAGG